MGIADRVSNLLSYQTFKIVQIRNWKLGVIHYATQLLILGFVIGFIIIYKKGYQSQGGLVGNVSIKLKGTAWIIDNNNETQVWDEYDLSPMPSTDTFFLTSNVHTTPRQSRGTCMDPENNITCTQDSDCAGPKSAGEGIMNGICNTTAKQCVLKAWCPMENENENSGIQGLDQMTAFIKVQVYFPNYGIYRNNVNGSAGQLTNNYNLFTVEKLLSMANTNYQEIQKNGGIFVVNVDFQCDFDHDANLCVPTFEVLRIDTATQLSVGYNFRYAHYYWSVPNGTTTEVQFRDLYKVYGPRFLVSLSGFGRKFDPLPLFLSIGSGLGLLGLASVFTDFITLYLVPQKKRYAEVKYEQTGDDFLPLLRSHMETS